MKKTAYSIIILSLAAICFSLVQDFTSTNEQITPLEEVDYNYLLDDLESSLLDLEVVIDCSNNSKNTQKYRRNTLFLINGKISILRLQPNINLIRLNQINQITEEMYEDFFKEKMPHYLGE